MFDDVTEDVVELAVDLLVVESQYLDALSGEPCVAPFVLVDVVLGAVDFYRQATSGQ